MNIVEATAAYETWLGSQIGIVTDDLQKKHLLMREAVFPFFRATFYRWSQLWPEICAALNSAPLVLAVGDLHVENFGTWRDLEGRLVWGINDFDEAGNMPYTIDLVRLAASAHLAINAGHLEIDHREACLSILGGYKDGLEAGGKPWVLGEKHLWLSELVALRDPVAFWTKLHVLDEFEGRVPKSARRSVEKMLPAKNLGYRLSHRVAGVGSLGRQRFVAVADYSGAFLCREAKALASSAWWWAGGEKGPGKIRYQQVLDRSVRALDPFVRLNDGWITRRLAPDCTRIELSAVPRQKEKSKLLHAMGWETANIHLGSGSTTAILKDLAARDSHWLHKNAAAMVDATHADWVEWGGDKNQPPAPQPRAPRAAKKVPVKRPG